MIAIGGVERPLILANNCLGGSAFTERVEAAAAAGFDGIGLSLPAYRSVTAHELPPTEMLAVLRANGVGLLEMEAIIGFAAETTADFGVLAKDLSYTTRADLDEFWRIADTFGPRHLQVAGSFHTADLEGRAAERFANLCDEAARHGLELCLEFVPPSNVPDAHVALQVVQEAARPNGKITVDSWSHTRSGGSLDFLRGVPAAHIGLLQLNDGTLQPELEDFIEETMRRRQAPGDGEFDLAGLIAAIVSTGSRPPVSIEVMSEELDRLPHEVAARRLGDGARSLFPAAA